MAAVPFSRMHRVIAVHFAGHHVRRFHLIARHVAALGAGADGGKRKPRYYHCQKSEISNVLHLILQIGYRCNGRNSL